MQATLGRETSPQEVRLSIPKAWRALPWQVVPARLDRGSDPPQEATRRALLRTLDYEEMTPSLTTIDWLHRHR